MKSFLISLLVFVILGCASQTKYSIPKTDTSTLFSEKEGIIPLEDRLRR